MSAQGHDARRAALSALLRIGTQGGYSNVVLEELIRGCSADAADRPLITRLVYGVTERRLTLDYLLNKASRVPVRKMEPPVREILRIGTYQLLYQDDTPDFAVVSETVELAKRQGYGRLTGYVNAVMREIARNADGWLGELPATDKGNEIRYSCPRHIIRSWKRDYGEENTCRLLVSINEAPPVYIRVNTLRTTTEDFRVLLERENVGYETVAGLPDALLITDPHALRVSGSCRQDMWYYQDIASQWCCRALDAHPGERIADVCAAPGGKSFTTAQYMKNVGVIDSADLYPEKCRGMEERARAYGMSAIRVHCRDASQPPADELIGRYDRVICDAPCSGWGVIRRKPEIRYKEEQDTADMPQIQQTILSNAALLVRPGGVLQYSTCTLRDEENGQVTQEFLRTHPEFSPRILPIPEAFRQAEITPNHELTLFPHVHGSDGFYIAGFIRTP